MWPIPWQRWHLIPVVQPVEATEEELFAGACKIEVLLPSSACDGCGSVVDHVSLVEGAATQNYEFRAILFGPNVILGVKVLALVLCWRPCNSFSATIASWNNLLVVLYSL